MAQLASRGKVAVDPMTGTRWEHGLVDRTSLGDVHGYTAAAEQEDRWD